MFDHLDTLDDTTPLAADDAMLERVRGRADRLRRRTRLSAIAAGVAVLAVAAGVAAVTRDQKHSVSVITPSSTSASTPTTTRAANGHSFIVGTLPNGLSVRMNLATETVQLGDDIHVDVVVTNNTFKSQTIGVGPVQCVVGVGLVLRDADGHFGVNGIQNTGCYDMGRILKRDQTVTIPASLSTESVRLPAGATEGRFELRLESVRGLTNDAPAPGSIGAMPISVRAPQVTARLIVPVTNVHPGDVIIGTFELENHGPELTIGCAGSPNYDISLTINGAALEPAHGLLGTDTGCREGSDVARTGISDRDFSVAARYYNCSSAGRTSPDSPRCITGTTIPPLRPGHYEIRFRGIGPLAGVHASPVPVTVASDNVSLGNHGLPKIPGASPALARDQFQHLYFLPGRPYTVALASRGAGVRGIYTSGTRLVIQIDPGPGAPEAQTLIRSLFEHPEFVDVEPTTIAPQ
jgi:hypothetical protein